MFCFRDKFSVSEFKISVKLITRIQWKLANWIRAYHKLFVVVGFYDTFKHLRSSASLPTLEREKADKFCSDALISAWGSFTCRKSTTGDPRLYFPSEGSHTQDFYALKKIHRSRPGLNPRTSDPGTSMITTGPQIIWAIKI